MKLKAIVTEQEYNAWLDWTDKMFDKKVKPESTEGERLKIALLLIKDYEDKHYPIPIPNLIETIKLKIEEKGLKEKDLIQIFGNQNYLQQILNGQKPLTLEIVRQLHKLLGIPAEVFLA